LYYRILSSFHGASSPVPIPLITGKCVYGHIVTNNHRDHFRRQHPNIDEGQSSDPEALVSIASLVIHQRGLEAATTEVYVQGKPHVCLVHVDRRLSMAIDKRRTRAFMDALEKVLGITEDPKWYPCYAN